MSAKLIRAWLRTQPDGATEHEISAALGIEAQNVNESVKRAPDIYIDRWTRSGTRFAPVWMAVEVPTDCPKPEPKSRKATA